MYLLSIGIIIKAELNNEVKMLQSNEKETISSSCLREQAQKG